MTTPWPLRSVPSTRAVNASSGISARTRTIESSALDANDSNTADGLCNDGAGHCTLRAAIEQADKLGGINTINVPAGTYNLSASLGTLQTTSATNNLTITGTGAPGTVIVDGQN